MLGCFLGESSYNLRYITLMVRSVTYKRTVKLIAKQIPAYFHIDTQTHPLSIYFDSIASQHSQHWNPSCRSCPQLAGEASEENSRLSPTARPQPPQVHKVLWWTCIQLCSCLHPTPGWQHVYFKNTGMRGNNVCIKYYYLYGVSNLRGSGSHLYYQRNNTCPRRGGALVMHPIIVGEKQPYQL